VKSAGGVRRGRVQSGHVSSAARKGAVQSSGALSSSIPTAKKKARRGTQLAASVSSRKHVRDDPHSSAMVATKEAGMSMPTRQLTAKEKVQREADKKRYERLKAADRKRRHYWLPDVKGSEDILTPQDARDMVCARVEVGCRMRLLGVCVCVCVCVCVLTDIDFYPLPSAVFGFVFCFVFLLMCVVLLLSFDPLPFLLSLFLSCS
jgi:hypothetical protein